MPAKSRSTTPGTVRIIGGRLRGSRLPVADSAGLRPTSDRVRETVFNWLQRELTGSTVIDMFAGSGALGIEALSRGAARVWLIERDRMLAHSLEAQLRRLQVDDVAQVICADALDPGLQSRLPRADLVLIDPPFAGQLWLAAIVQARAWLADDGWVYLESAASAAPQVPADWQLHREGRTRDVHFALYRRIPQADPATGRTTDDA